MCVHMCLHTYGYVCVYICIHTYVCKCACVCIYIGTSFRNVYTQKAEQQYQTPTLHGISATDT
jgi:hypothetical protein